MRSFKHWTPKYVLRRSLLWLHQRRHPEEPWLTADSIALLDTWLRKTDVGIEWGAGRSTRWISSRVARLISIEHNPAWYARVKRSLPMNVDLRLYRTDGKEADGGAYVKCVESLEDDSLDFALVDGFSPVRDLCASAVIPKLKLGGLLIIDNAHWYIPFPSESPDAAFKTGRAASPAWEEVVRTIKPWRYFWTTNGVWDTAMWIKSSAR